MRKLAKLDMRPTEDPEVAATAATAADQGLAEVFTRPLDEDYFAAFRDVFPVARVLSDTDLMAAARRVNDASFVR
jgi:hypothetical protein